MTIVWRSVYRQHLKWAVRQFDMHTCQPFSRILPYFSLLSSFHFNLFLWFPHIFKLQGNNQHNQGHQTLQSCVLTAFLCAVSTSSSHNVKMLINSKPMTGVNMTKYRQMYDHNSRHVIVILAILNLGRFSFLSGKKSNLAKENN